MKWLLLLLALWQPTVTPRTITPASIHGSAPSGSPCPQGGSLGDGCPSPNGGVYTVANFSAHARQSGQTWTSAHPWAWNAPGVDYPVGYYTAAGSLKDPTTASLPSGCSYLATGSLNGGPEVKCQSVANPTISGYDFSLHNCVPLDIKGASVTGTITITNNKFQNGPNCSKVNAVVVGSISGSVLTVASVTSGAVVVGNYLQGGSVVTAQTAISSNGTGSGGTGTYNLGRSWNDAGPTTYTIGLSQDILTVENGSTAVVDFENNYLNGDALNYPLSTLGAAFSNTGNVTVKYSVFLNMPGWPVALNTSGALLVEYNYFENFNYSPTDGHGEAVINSPPGSITLPSQQYSYNVCLQGAVVLAGNSTTCFWLGGGDNTDTVTSSEVDHSIGITNLTVGNSYSTAGAVSEVQAMIYTNITFLDNYSDPTGALYTFYTPVSPSSHVPTCTNPTSFSGNVLLTTGASVNAYQTAPTGGC